MTARASSPLAAGRALSPATDGQGPLPWRPASAAVLVFFVAAALATGLIWHDHDDRQREARELAGDLVAERMYAIQGSIDRALSPTYALLAMLQQGSGTIARFEATAGQLLRYQAGVAALQLAPGGVVRQVAPLNGKEQVMGRDLRADPAAQRAALLARDSGQMTLTAPFRRSEGGIAVAGLLPVFLDDGDGRQAFWGFAIALIALPEALAPARLAELVARGYAYQLSLLPAGSDQRLLIDTSPTLLPIEPVERHLQVANATWTLRIAPAQGWIDLAGLSWKAGVALLLCLLLAWQAASQAQLLARARTHERDLERRVAQRTADLQRFAEISAHHLREPARRVASYAGHLRARLAGRVDDDEVQLSLDFIGQQAGKLQNLLRDIELYLAADQAPGALAPCDVDKTLGEVLAMLAEPLAEADARLAVGRLPGALIDAPRLASIFRITLDNALRHGRGERPLRLEIAGERHGERVRYRICDNGPGVEAVYRQRVFRLFERLSSTGEGTGVGLAILRRIAESVGGRAWLEESAGGGCCVLLDLPAAEQQRPAERCR
ncbi:MAG: CHASE domain-containing protein [Rhodobacteraceae bacterium]|nr:CHASE domain-containing protein [Paracoccaceae bacterium]